MKLYADRFLYQYRCIKNIMVLDLSDIIKQQADVSVMK